MEQWAWQELSAQVEDHGPGAIQFYDSKESDVETGDYATLTVTDVLFEDDEIRVVLE